MDKLVAYVNEHDMKNVMFIPYQPKEELNYSLNAADVHWVVNAAGIKGVSCPSKYYGVAATGLPILGVLEEETEVRMLIEEIQNGLVSEPGDYCAVENNLRWFVEQANNLELREMGDRGHAHLMINLTRRASVKKYIDSILKA